MTNNVSGARPAISERVPSRGAFVAWAGFIAASATILAVTFG